MKYRIIFLTLALVALISSCTSKNQTQDAIPGDYSLFFSEGSVDISPLGKEYSLSFTSNAKWTLTSSEPWINFSKESGREGTYVVTLLADVNRTREARSAEVTLTNDKTGETKMMTVNQDFPYLRMKLSDSEGNEVDVKDTLLFAWNMSEESHVEAHTIIIESNVDWKIDTTDVFHCDNFLFSSVSGNGNAEISFSAINNNLDIMPYGTLFNLSGYMGENKETVIGEGVDSYAFNISQANLKFLINSIPANAEIELSELNDDSEQQGIIVEAEVPWKVNDCPDWVVIDKNSGEEDEPVVMHIAADGVNPSRDERTCTIRLETTVGAERAIVVKQRAYVLSVDTNVLTLQNDDTSVHEIKLNTTGSWKVSEVPSWLEVSPVEGTGAAMIIVRSRLQNLDTEDVSSVVKINSMMNSLVEDVHLSQARFVFDVIAPTSLSDMPAMSTADYEVKIESSGAWEITGRPSWVNVTSESADSKGTYVLKVGPNSGNPDKTVARTAELKVVSLAHRSAGKELSKSIIIRQRQYEFNVSKSILEEFDAYKPDADSVVVKCSSAWTVITPDWITPSVTSGDGGRDVTVVFTPKDNLQKVKLEGKILIVSSYDNESLEIAVSQSAFVFDSAAVEVPVPAVNASPAPVVITISPNAPWSISEGYAEWLHPSNLTGTGSSTISFTTDQNDSSSSRLTAVSVLSELTGEMKAITFIQEAFQPGP